MKNHMILKSFLYPISSQLNENYCAHGAKVVEFYQNTAQGLIHLERIWREHFLHTMKPEFLPELWSVEHSVER